MIRNLPSLVRHLGLKWVGQRLWFALEHRLGVLRHKAPSGSWEDHAALSSHGPRLDLALSLRRACDASRPDDEVVDLRGGRLRLFSGQAVKVGNPPDWHRCPLTGHVWPHDVHWDQISDASAVDIKGVWEASRWSWVYPLARAYLCDHDPRHADLFWRWAEDWMAKNPPNLGVNWKCGQEASFRLFAAAWAISVFSDAPSTTPARLQMLARLAHVTAGRIEAHLAYAVSQDNNHGVSEAVGLLTVGVLWPELPRAARLRDMGLRVLAGLCDRLIAPDGSFSQHSSNYHRVLLDDLCWAAAVARVGDVELPENVAAAARRAADFLHALLLPDGSVVRYGADDGARVLQMSPCAYGDFRPTLSACSALFGSKPVPPGVWDDQAAALCATTPAGALPEPMPREFSGGGLHLRRSGPAAIAFRAPTVFKTRPSHADQLHVSVHDGSQPLVEDVGTLSYNDPARPWADLAGARFHNVPSVDGADPMGRAGRFLWLPWTTCRLEVDEPGRLIASHRGYPGFVVRRELFVAPDHVRVTDTFEGNRVAELSVRWHGRDRAKLELMEIACQSGPGETAWHSADAATGLGFFADRYASVIPSHCRVFSVRAQRAVIVTHIPLSGG